MYRPHTTTVRAIEADLLRFRESIAPPAIEVSFHVRRLFRAVHQELFNPRLNVKMLKRVCNLRDNNISSQFMCETGMYLSDYILELRLKAAVQLLARYDLSTARVAWLVGFGSLQTLHRAFKRRFGSTPGAVRSQLATPRAAAQRDRLLSTAFSRHSAVACEVPRQPASGEDGR